MKNKYSKFTVKDFLNDHFFMTTILNETPESIAYWKALLEENEGIRANFEEAKRILLDDAPNLQIHQTKRLSEDIWLRIKKTNKRKKRIILLKEVSQVAAVVLFIGLCVSTFIIDTPLVKDKNDVADNITINIKKDDLLKKGVLLKTNDSLINIPEAEDIYICYLENGTLEINNKPIKLSKLIQNEAIEGLYYNELVVPYGKRTTLTLSDGSTLHVNSGTTIKYPVEFSSQRRDIYVDGEIFINVTKDKKRPFYVHTHVYTAEVLGTSFNVSAYSEDESASILLVTGQVKVSNANFNKIITPNQMVQRIDNEDIVKENINVNNYTSWTEGIYRFQNESLDNILLRVAKYYGVSITYPSSIKLLRFSGSLDLKEDQERVFHGLCMTANIDYKEHNKEQFEFTIKNKD